MRVASGKYTGQSGWIIHQVEVTPWGVVVKVRLKPSEKTVMLRLIDLEFLDGQRRPVGFDRLATVDAAPVAPRYRVVPLGWGVFDGLTRTLVFPGDPTLEDPSFEEAAQRAKDLAPGR